MAHDEQLAERVRRALSTEKGVEEKKMFGGLAFLFHGHMGVAVSGKGGLMLRVNPEDTKRLVGKSHAQPMVMKGHPLRGWLRVDHEGFRTKAQLETWVERALSYVRALPPKKGSLRRPAARPLGKARPRRRA